MDLTEKRELAQEADGMLKGAFGKAVLNVRKRLFDRLLVVPVNSYEAAEIHAKLKLLPDITDELTIFINNYTAAQQRGRK